MKNWDNLRYFSAVARTKSLRGAAKQLNVDHSTVSRHINALECELNTRLFDRTPGGFVLTDAGTEVIESALCVEQEMDLIQRKIQGKDAELSGTIRVTLAAPFAKLLMPTFAQFARDFPAITLEFCASYLSFNLAKREADVAIRATNLPNASLFGRRVLRYSRCAYISRSFSENGEPGDMSYLNWTGYEPHVGWDEDPEKNILPVKHGIDDLEAQLAAAKCGLGIALLPCWMGDAHSDLVRVIGWDVEPERDIWVLTHEDLQNNRRIRTFMKTVIEALLEMKPEMEGKLES